jgi:hypothetical protein
LHTLLKDLELIRSHKHNFSDTAFDYRDSGKIGLVENFVARRSDDH